METRPNMSMQRINLKQGLPLISSLSRTRASSTMLRMQQPILSASKLASGLAPDPQR